MEKKLSREKAWELLTEYTKTPALRKHALAVEAVMASISSIRQKVTSGKFCAKFLHSNASLFFMKYQSESIGRSWLVDFSVLRIYSR